MKATTPIEVSHGLSESVGDLLADAQKGQYQRLVGRLVYLTLMRPNPCYAMIVMSQFMHVPRISHLRAVELIVKYLKSGRGKGVLLKNAPHLQIEGLADADWVGSRDDCHSTTGYLCLSRGEYGHLEKQEVKCVLYPIQKQNIRLWPKVWQS